MYPSIPSFAVTKHYRHMHEFYIGTYVSKYLCTKLFSSTGEFVAPSTKAAL